MLYDNFTENNLLTKRFKYLCDEQKQQVNVMLYASAALPSAHFLKEKFLDILDCNDKQSAKNPCQIGF